MSFQLTSSADGLHGGDKGRLGTSAGSHGASRGDGGRVGRRDDGQGGGGGGGGGGRDGTGTGGRTDGV